MNWLVQEYDDGVHVVPTGEPGHVLDRGCFCEPKLEPVNGALLLTHRDLAQRIFEDSPTLSDGTTP